MSVLGNKLRDARIEKGYTLNTLQQKTKIQKKYLQAIEEGNFEDLPGHYYVRAFVKQYADMVGINGDQLLEDYEDEYTTNKQESLDIDESPIPSRISRFQNSEKNQWEIIFSYLPLILLTGIILLIIGTLVFAIQSIGNNENKTVQKNIDNSAVVSVVEPDNVDIEKSQEKEETSQSTQEVLAENQIRVGKQILTLLSEPTEETLYQLENPVDEYEFEVKADEFVWVGIYEDDIIQVDTTVAAGESVKFKANPETKTVRLRLGYVEGGKFYVNGKEIDAKSDYIKETILFQLSDDPKPSATTNESIPLDLPETVEDSQAEMVEEIQEGEADQEDNEAYQGPAVYDPNYE